MGSTVRADLEEVERVSAGWLPGVLVSSYLCTVLIQPSLSGSSALNDRREAGQKGLAPQLEISLVCNSGARSPSSTAEPAFVVASACDGRCGVGGVGLQESGVFVIILHGLFNLEVDESPCFISEVCCARVGKVHGHSDEVGSDGSEVE